MTRQVLEAASVVRRVTRPLLRRLCPEVAPEDAYQRLAALPFVEVRPDGLRLHDAVREAIAATLRAADPTRHRDCRRAAWGELRSQVRSAGLSELWRYTADMLYIIENPVVREAFFPSGALPLSVEPARAGDVEAIVSIARAHEGPRAAALLERWWQRRPEAFSVVREADGSIGGFSCVLDPEHLSDEERGGDPLVDLWWRHFQQARPADAQTAIFCRRWLTRAAGERPCPGQAACWIDLKRAYMEKRPGLRRVYLTVVDLPTYAPAALKLGFQPIAGEEVALDGRTYHSAFLDMGSASVDGWLAGLVAAELGIEPGGGLVDADARQLVLDGGRVELTQLEYGVIAYLAEHEGRAVPRSELLERVWERSYSGGSNVIDVVVRSLRRKLAERAAQIETVRGIGYRFRPD